MGKSNLAERLVERLVGCEVQKLSGLEWTEEWPTEPGTYLFYGNYHGTKAKPHLEICKANESMNGVLTLTAGAAFLYSSEQYGMFARLELEMPVPQKWRQIDFYRRAFNILVAECDPSTDVFSGQSAFVNHFVEKGGKEWRFQGTLGFGGKFWNNGGWYVNCYVEDETPERKATKAKVNGLLDELVAETGMEP